MTKSPHPSSVDKGELLPCQKCGTANGPARFEEPEQFLIGCACWSDWYPTKEAAREAWLARQVLCVAAGDDHSAVFTIRLEPEKTSCHTTAGDLTNPLESIDRAIAVLLHEKTKIEHCPRHREVAAIEANQAHSLPGDVGMREALAALETGWDDVARYGLSTTICCSGEECACQGTSLGQYLAHELRAALTPSALSGDAGEVWQPIETCPTWAVAVVTDGISVAISQRAEADDGSPYWAVDPEDGLDWEPTYWVPALDEHLPSQQGTEP